jgi:hypothetical protein
MRIRAVSSSDLAGGDHQYDDGILANGFAGHALP